MSVCAAAVVYNEESRLGGLLETLRWCDEVVVVDKSSTDGTRRVAESYGAKLILTPYSDAGDEIKLAVEAASSEWMIFLTASDMVHPGLARKLKEIAGRKDFPYDVVEYPYMVGTFGVFSPRSPWDYPLKRKMARRSAVVCGAQVHKETSFSSNRVYRMEKDRVEAVYHFTHQSVDSFIERHCRYAKAEATLPSSEAQGMLRALFETFAALGWTAVWRRTWLLGWDGVALMLAFASYFIFKLLYVWERFRGKGEGFYAPLRKELLAAWAEENAKPKS